MGGRNERAQRGIQSGRGRPGRMLNRWAGSRLMTGVLRGRSGDGCRDFSLKCVPGLVELQTEQGDAGRGDLELAGYFGRRVARGQGLDDPPVPTRLGQEPLPEVEAECDLIRDGCLAREECDLGLTAGVTMKPVNGPHREVLPAGDKRTRDILAIRRASDSASVPNAEDRESRQRRGKDAPPASSLHKPPVSDQCCCNRLLKDLLPESLGNSAKCELELTLNGGD
jgi:hypothetical protein